MNKKKNIVYLGCSGFPYGLAEIQKIILISKGLVKTGNTVTVICKRGMHNVEDRPDMPPTGNFEGIDYIYPGGTPFRHPKFVMRNYLKVKGVINEYKLLRKLKKENRIDDAILSTHSYYAVLWYYILSKIIGFKTVLNYVEYYSGVKKKWYKFDKWLNDKLYDRFAPKMVDSVFLISEFLIQHLKKISPKKKYLKIPNLTDVSRFNGIELKKGDDYFLFCGDAGYFEIIKFIIDAFDELNTNNAWLYLVINGKDHDKDHVKEYMAQSKSKARIKFLTKLTDRELSTYYMNSIGLLIPLRPTFQDKARFPHKIGEYLASGSPVISTNYGEVSYYFKDMENMLIAESYDKDQFAAKMQYVLDNPVDLKRIAKSGQEIAFTQFEYTLNGERISDFLNELNLNGK